MPAVDPTQPPVKMPEAKKSTVAPPVNEAPKPAPKPSEELRKKLEALEGESSDL